MPNLLKIYSRLARELFISLYIFVVVLSLRRVRLLETPWTAAQQTFLPFIISRNLLKLMSIESVTLSNHLIFCHPLPLLPSIFPSIRVFSDKSALHIYMFMVDLTIQIFPLPDSMYVF